MLQVEGVDVNIQLATFNLLMFMPVLLRAEMTVGFHRRAALRAGRASARDDFRAPTGHLADLLTRAPEIAPRRLFPDLRLPPATRGSGAPRGRDLCHTPGRLLPRGRAGPRAG